MKRPGSLRGFFGVLQAQKHSKPLSRKDVLEGRHRGDLRKYATLAIFSEVHLSQAFTLWRSSKAATFRGVTPQPNLKPTETTRLKGDNDAKA